MAENRTKQEWLDLIDKSEGQMVLLPESLNEKAETFRKIREEFLMMVRKMAKMEIEQSVLVNEIVYEMRKDLEAKGHADVWTKDIGFNTDALESGGFVMNVNEPQRR